MANELASGRTFDQLNTGKRSTRRGAFGAVVSQANAGSYFSSKLLV